MNNINDGAEIQDNAELCDNAMMFDLSTIRGNAKMRDNSMIYDSAELSGDAEMIGDSIIGEWQQVGWNNTVVVNDLRKDLKESIRCQTGLIPFDNKVIAYQQVRKDMTNRFNKKINYEVGKVAVYEKVVDRNCPIARGLCFSNANRWNKEMDVRNSIFFVAEIDLGDIINVRNGEIICTKAKIIGKYEIGE